ncbi:hypothetical protein [Bradyrhizobium guangzhouense]|nr:hypothetical protein [Bradyrhizobium guangzhouense]
MTPLQALAPLPPGLRTPLLEYYEAVVADYKQERWDGSIVNAGKFCETVYTILNGYPKDYEAAPRKPSNFPEACRRLENEKANTDASRARHIHYPRAIQIHIPRALPAIYETRNNRGAHVGQIDPNRMDASFVVPACSWVLAELVRVFVTETGDTRKRTPNVRRRFTTKDAQALVDELTQQPVLVVWESGETQRVLDVTLNLPHQILLLAAAGPTTKSKIKRATEHYTERYLSLALGRLHADRLIEFNRRNGSVRLTSLGIEQASILAARFRKRVDLNASSDGVIGTRRSVAPGTKTPRPRRRTT